MGWAALCRHCQSFPDSSLFGWKKRLCAGYRGCRRLPMLHSYPFILWRAPREFSSLLMDTTASSPLCSIHRHPDQPLGCPPVETGQKGNKDAILGSAPTAHCRSWLLCCFYDNSVMYSTPDKTAGRLCEPSHFSSPFVFAKFKYVNK